jgi:hypothetical protein
MLSPLTMPNVIRWLEGVEGSPQRLLVSGVNAYAMPKQQIYPRPQPATPVQ